MRFTKLTVMTFLMLFSFVSKAQTVTKTFTIIPFADLNNNCIYDMGEDTLVNFRLQVMDPVNYYGSAGQSSFTGKYYGSITAPAASPNYSIQQLDGLIEPCAVAASGSIPYFTVYYLPIKPVILNAPVGYGSTFFSPIQGKLYRYAPMDTLKYCSGNLNAGSYNCFFEVHNNKTSISSFFNGTMTVKLDLTTIDSYTFTSNASGAFTSANSSGTIVSNQSDQVLMLKYNLPNTPITAGIHTLSVQFSPFTGYTQPSIMKMTLNADSCGSVIGQAYLDCNNNCSYDFGETYGGNNISSVQLANATNTVITYPSSNGLYSANAPIGIYTVTASGSNSSYSVCPVVSFTTNITYSSSLTLNYGVKEINPNSMDYSTFLMLSGANPGPGAVPGGSIAVNVYNNNSGGPICIPNPTLVPSALKVVLPIEMSYVNVIGSTPVPSSIIPCATGDTIVWNNPGVTALHKISVYTATNAIIGNSYCIKSIIYPLVDNYPSNNIYTRCNTFGGPFDPNEKTAEALNMFPNGNILPNTTDLIYTIEFQNLGNGPAVNISINDTIDSNLDLSSLQVISSSFPVQTQMNVAARVIDFKFKGIYLQASSVNEPASHGYVRYKINLNPGLPLGTSIKNRGHIYFDYNTAVSTNKTNNTIALTTGNNESELGRSIMVYPNPTNDDLNIQASSVISTVEIVNVIGQTVLSKTNVNNKSTFVDLSSLNKGVYFIQMNTVEGMVTKKIIKN